MYVPDFELVHVDSALSPSKKPSVMEDDIIELLWQNGQVVTQSQNSLRSLLKKPQHQPPLPAPSPPSKFDQTNNPQSTARILQQQQQQQQRQLFMQEDEMTSWLHHEANFADHDDFFPAGFLYPPHLLPPPPPSSSGASSSTTTVAAPLPQPVSRMEAVANFPLFSRQRAETAPSGIRSFPAAVVRESTMVESSVNQELSGDGGAGKSGGGAANSNATTNRETASETSSPGGSSASVEPSHQAPTAGGGQKSPPDHGRKRKGVDEDLDYRSEDTEFESDNPKKQPQPLRSTSTKRSRAAEVHNLSERRRRDRINEKMKALQELIPRCNKSDKASMLDEAIEYLKSLQLQVQMMSMGCGMVPMMFHGVQQYMSPIGMGLGVGMGMEMSMNRPMMPFHNVLAGASLPATAAHLGPRFSAPAFHMPPGPTDLNRMQGAGPRDSMLNSAGLPVPNFTDPYHQNLSLHQMQLPVSQNQASVHSNGSGKPSNSQGTNNLVNNLSGQ